MNWGGDWGESLGFFSYLCTLIYQDIDAKNAANKTQILRINKNVAIFVVKKGLCYVYPSTSAMASFRLE